MGAEQSSSMKGLDECPGNYLTHNYDDHPDEVDICDLCHEEKLCIIRCALPKSRKLRRRCKECYNKMMEEKKKQNDLFLDKIIEIKELTSPHD